ncbi:MAG: diguanylate cyclase [Roseibium sp.]
MATKTAQVENSVVLRTAASEEDPETDTSLFASLIAKHCTDSIVFTDPLGFILWVNEPFVAMTGYNLEDVKGKKPGTILQGQDTDPRTVEDISQALSNRRMVRTEILNYSKDGEPYWIDLSVSPVHNSEGVLTHFMSVERDITDRKKLSEKTERALQLETERRRERKILSQMSEWLFSARSQNELHRVISSSMAKMFPGTVGSFFVYSNSRDVLENVCAWGEEPSHKHIHADECWSLRRGRAYSHGTTEIYFACEHVEQSENVYFCLPIIAHGDTIGLMHIAFPDLPLDGRDNVQVRDAILTTWELALICAEQVSLAIANVKLHDELQQNSVKDALTGLWNRRWFVDRAHREIKRAAENDNPFTVISLDIDHFKKFNDTYGHDAGDMVLKTFSIKLQEQFTEKLFPCRLGGEEFAILCCGTDLSEITHRLNDLRAVIVGHNIIYDGKQLPPITFSSGIARLKEGEDLEAFMKRSDDALYVAKAEGRGRDALAE